MATESLTKMQVPEGTDSVAPLADLFTALADSARVPIPVASGTELAQVVTAASTAGFAATAAKPMFFYRTDTKRMYVHDGSSAQPISAILGKSAAAILSGTATLTHTGSGTEGITVNFPGGYFTSAPEVVFSVGPSTAAFDRQTMGAVSTSSASLFVTTSTAREFTLRWTAIQAPVV